MNRLERAFAILLMTVCVTGVSTVSAMATMGNQNWMKVSWQAGMVAHGYEGADGKEGLATARRLAYNTEAAWKAFLKDLEQHLASRRVALLTDELGVSVGMDGVEKVKMLPPCFSGESNYESGSVTTKGKRKVWTNPIGARGLVPPRSESYPTCLRPSPKHYTFSDVEAMIGSGVPSRNLIALGRGIDSVILDGKPLLPGIEPWHFDTFNICKRCNTYCLGKDLPFGRECIRICSRVYCFPFASGG